jgi:Zn-finger nucleic acid-binding protein
VHVPRLSAILSPVNPYREAPAPDRPCPRCGVGLADRPVADVRIGECPRCAGVFVPAHLIPRFLDALDLGGEVMATFPSTPTTVRPPGGPMYVKCPRCAVLMNRRQFAPGAKVVVDVCRDHGLWLDDGELRALAGFAAAGGIERARAEEVEARQRAQSERLRHPAPSSGGLVGAATQDVGTGSPLADLVRWLIRW